MSKTGSRVKAHLEVRTHLSLPHTSGNNECLPWDIEDLSQASIDRVHSGSSETQVPTLQVPTGSCSRAFSDYESDTGAQSWP